MFAALLPLIPIFGIMLLGGFAQRRHILPGTTAANLNQFVYWFSLPCLLFYIMAQIRLEHIPVQAASGFLLGLACTHAGMSIIMRFVGYKAEEACMVGFVGCFPNAAFMGISMVMLLFPHAPEVHIAAGVTTLLPTFSLVFTDTYLSVRNQGRGAKLGATLGKIGKSMLHNPPLIGASLGALVGLSGMYFPQSFLELLRMMGNTAAPCALFCMGMALAQQVSQWSAKKASCWKIQTILIGGKLVISPIVTYILSYMLGVRDEMLATVTLIAAMPTAVVCYIIAMQHAVFEEESSLAIALGTFVSAITLPVTIFLLLL